MALYIYLDGLQDFERKKYYKRHIRNLILTDDYLKTLELREKHF